MVLSSGEMKMLSDIIELLQIRLGEMSDIVLELAQRSSNYVHMPGPDEVVAPVYFTVGRLREITEILCNTHQRPEYIHE